MRLTGRLVTVPAARRSGCSSIRRASRDGDAAESSFTNLAVADLDSFGVFGVVEFGVDVQPGAGDGRGDQVDHDLVAGQGTAAPVREMWLNRRCSILFHLEVPGGKWQTVIVEAGARRRARRVPLPQPGAIAVGAARVGGDQKSSQRPGNGGADLPATSGGWWRRRTRRCRGRRRRSPSRSRRRRRRPRTGSPCPLWVREVVSLHPLRVARSAATRGRRSCTARPVPSSWCPR